jgi:arsenate reductase
MVMIYGIKNCDVVQKALKWLDRHGIAYVFHDYKVSGIDPATITNWLQHVPLDQVINSRSTTFRALSDADKASINNISEAKALMIAHNSIIKRPILDLGEGNIIIGWNEEVLTARLLK